MTAGAARRVAAARATRLGVLWAAGVAAVPLLSLPGLSGESSGLLHTVAAVVWITAFCAVSLVASDAAPAMPPGVSRVALPALALLGLGAVSLSWAVVPWPGAARLVIWSTAGLGFWLGARLVRDDATAVTVLRLLSGAAVLLSLLGLAQRFAGLDWVPQAAAPAATFGNRGVAIEAVVVMAPLGAAWLVPRARGWRLAAGAAALGLPAGFVLCSGVRAGLLAIACQLAVVALVWRRPGQRLLPRLAGVVAVAVAASALAAWARPAGTARYPKGLSFGVAQAAGPGFDESLGIRSELLRVAGRMFGAAPLTGVGLGGYPALYREVAARHGGWLPGDDTEVESAHNEAGQLAAELGLLGLLLAGAVCWRVGSAALSLRGNPSRAASVLRLAGAASATGFAVASAFGSPAQRMVPALALAVTLGVLAGRHSPEPADPSRPSRGRRRLAPLVATLFLCAAALAVGVRGLAGTRSLGLAREALGRGDLTGAIDLAGGAVRVSPWEPRGHLLLATALLRSGRAAEALAPLEQLQSLRPFWVSAVGNLGLARLALGESESAGRLLASARRLAPSSPRLGATPLPQERSSRQGVGAGASVRPAEERDPACAGLTLGIRGTRLDLRGSSDMPALLRCLSEELGFELDYPDRAPKPDLPEIRITDSDSVVAIERLLSQNGVDYAMSLSADGTSLRALLIFESRGRPAGGSRPSPQAQPPEPPEPAQGPRPALPGLTPPGMDPSGGVFPEPRGLSPLRAR